MTIAKSTDVLLRPRAWMITEQGEEVLAAIVMITPESVVKQEASKDCHLCNMLMPTLMMTPYKRV